MGHGGHGYVGEVSENLDDRAVTGQEVIGCFDRAVTGHEVSGCFG
jgi:hypothetical protein